MSSKQHSLPKPFVAWGSNKANLSKGGHLKDNMAYRQQKEEAEATHRHQAEQHSIICHSIRSSSLEG